MNRGKRQVERDVKKIVCLNSHYYQWIKENKINKIKVSDVRQISALKATINSFLVQMDKYRLIISADTITWITSTAVALIKPRGEETISAILS